MRPIEGGRIFRKETVVNSTSTKDRKAPPTDQKAMSEVDSGRPGKADSAGPARALGGFNAGTEQVAGAYQKPTGKSGWGAAVGKK